MIVKTVCPLIQMLDTLLHTLIREQQNEAIPGRAERAREVARRFVRSVARIFVIFSVEMAPGAAKKKGYAFVFTLNIFI